MTVEAMRAKGPRSGYHHGNLPAVLIKTALDTLERAGAEELSLRTIAASAGVSRAAPYAHFAHKQDLLAAVARVGFDSLAADMLRDVDEAANARERFVGSGRGYVRFALENPNLFKLMFSAELKPPRDFGTLESNAHRTYRLFVELLEALLAERAPHLAGSRAVRNMAWSIFHGLALLLIERRLPVPEDGVETLVDEVSESFVRLLDDRAGSDRPS